MLNKRILVLMFLLLFLPLVGCLTEPNQRPIITSDPVKTATVGLSYTYDVEATDPDEDTLTYFLTKKPSGMFINSATGLISWKPIPVQIGDNSVIVTVSDGFLNITQSFTITVSKPAPTPVPVKLTKIVVLPSTMILIVGESETIVSVTAHYSNGSTKDIALSKCAYVSSATGVATVDTGKVTAVAEGTATITVMYVDKTDTIAVTVNPIRLTSIVVLPETMLFLEADYSKTITSVTAHYNNGTKAEIALGDCTYLSSNTLVATVLAGNVSKSGLGTATITVMYEDKTDTVEVIVGPVHNVTKDTYHNKIQEAINGATSGDTIEASAGTYNEDVTIGKVGITLQSGTKHEAVIEGTVEITSNDVIVDGFSIKGFSQIPTPDWSGIYMPSGTGILVVNNLIDGTAIDPVASLTVGIHTLYGGTAEATLEGNTIRNVRMGIYSQGDSLLIKDNTIEDTAHCGIGIDTALGIIITGNTISNCGLMGIEVFGPNVVANFNNITGNTNFGVWSAGAQVDATNNWWGDASGPSGVGPGNGDAITINVVYDPWSTIPY